MFELTVAPPSRHGLTREQAEGRVAEDGLWIAEDRRLVERSCEVARTPAADELLAGFLALVEAREEAIAELRA